MKVNCDNCGKEKYERPSVIKNNKNVFCSHKCYSDFYKGKKRKIKKGDNLVGKRIGIQTVIKEGSGRIYKGNKSVRTWIVKCDCGNIRELSTQSLKLSKSCGCIRLKPEHNHSYRTDRVDAVCKELYRSYKKGAIRRKLNFDLNYNTFKKLVLDSCYYCGEILPLKTRRIEDQDKVDIIGIDRKDNTKGYTVENSVSCCSICNYMKRKFSPEIFINQAIKISKKHVNNS